MTLTELSIKRPSVVVVVFTACGILGLFSFFNLKYELLPKIEPPTVSIITTYPGASAEEVQNSVGKVLENAIAGIEKIEFISMASSEGVNAISIQFFHSANVRESLQEVERKISSIRNNLPTGIKEPQVFRFALDELPVLRLGVTSSLSDVEFFQLIDKQIKPSISNVGGVGEVSTVGGRPREIKVSIRQEKLEAYKLSLGYVLQTIESSNLDFPTGNVKDDYDQYTIRMSGKLEDLEKLLNLVLVKSKDLSDVRLSDIAVITNGPKEAKEYNRINEKPSIGINISKQSDANAVEVSKNVRELIKKLETYYDDINLKFEIGQDGSTFTIDAADSVKFDLMFAIFLVASTMLLFLHSLRNALIVMVSIPTSLLTTFIVMNALDYSLNLMTLLAYSLVVGVLVDDSIVVLENIYRFIEKGLNKKSAALKGRNDIGFTAISITLIDVVVFVPLTLASGIVGNIMREFATVMIFSTLVSLLVSFMVTPALASRLSKKEILHGKTLWQKIIIKFESLYQKLTLRYEKLLVWSLHHKKVVGLATAGSFFSIFLLFAGGFIGVEFISVADRGEFSILLSTSQTSTLEKTNKLTSEVEKILINYPGVKRIMTSVGTTNEGLIKSSSQNIAEIMVTLVSKEKRSRSTNQIITDIKSKLSSIVGIYYRVNPVGIFGTADLTPIQILALHPIRDSSVAAGKKIEQALLNIDGTADVSNSADNKKIEIVVDINREKMAELGLTIRDIGSTMRIAFAGNDDLKYRYQGEEYPIRITLDDFNKKNIDDVKNLSFINAKNQAIKLKQFASVFQTEGVTVLQRFSRQNSTWVTAQVTGGATSGNIGAAFEEKLKTIQLPEKTRISYLGDLRNQQESGSSLIIVMLAGIVFMYLIMVLLYNSYLYPLVVLLTIPLAIIGAMYALALSGSSINIFSALGMIVLIGLVGKNAIILVDFCNKLLQEGKPLFAALVEAGRLRLRPILMTTVSMIFGVMPIAINSGAGSEWKQGLAWVIIGGLLSSTLLTLIVIPSVFMKFEEWKQRVSVFFDQKLGSEKRKESLKLERKIKS